VKVTDLKWHTRDDGETWTLSGDCKGSDAIIVNRKLFEIAYLGRGRGGGRMRWKIQDRRYWVDIPEFAHVHEAKAWEVYDHRYWVDIPEFAHVHEAKAWVESVVRLET
jgi:hypothetical protein